MLLKMFEKISLSTLVGVGAGVGMIGGFSGIFLYSKIQARIRRSEFYKEGLEVLFHNSQAQKALGLPIKIADIDVHSMSEHMERGVCKLTIPVIGADDRGHLYLQGVYVGADQNKKCKLTQLDLHLELAQKKYLIYENVHLKEENILVSK